MLDIFPRGVENKANPNAFPDAAWASPATLTAHAKWKFEPGAILAGRIGNTPLGLTDDRHLITVAGSRAGKGRSAIIPNMCLYPGSIVAIDPKGDLATVTAARRGNGSNDSGGMGQDVFVLDPFESAQGAASDYRASFNPLDMIDADGPYGRDDAALLADALIIPSKVEQHWTDAARLLLTGVILHICATCQGEERSLIAVRKALTADMDGFAELLAEMSVSETADGVVARAANTLIAMSDKERAGVLSTAIVQTGFLDSPAMRSVLQRSDFMLGDLKEKPTSVYLSLPAGRMGTHSRWLRLMIALTIEAMERNRTKPSHPVLIIMDEFHALGQMNVIERAAGLIAGFGVRLWPILQDISQLKALYPQSWETFLGNAGLSQWFGINDLTTLEYLSKRLGQTTLDVVSQGEISKGQAMNGFSGKSLSKQVVSLMSAEEISRYFSRQSGRQLLLYPGSDPIAVARIDYDSDPLLTGKFDADPNYS
ncbi:type IV secretory system conjugative DNA transfer family protein [Hyphococcus luteus]|uniref:TRAG family protein n=1 Tax=Hyphococcus luteus TaxID=2058213 RepID=A0A2S7K0K0_9PROT|nr:type IV secretory system conjugative DNA transfer family protein [Marinicaulis flavus]PQA86029.1 TRAG family protein [Marinicaulis flavus]